MKRLISLTLVCLLVSIMLINGPASAAININGAMWQQDISPGEAISKAIEISTNSDDKPTNFTIQLFDLGQTIQGINIPAEDGTVGQYSAASFLKASPANFRLEPGASQTVLVEGTVPKDVGSGSRYAMISVRTVDTKKGKKVGSNVGISLESDIPIVLSITDSELIQTGKITDLKAEEPISASQINASITFKNTGNTHYKAKAKAELMDEKGNLAAEAETKISFSSIVPSFSHLFELSLKPGAKLEPGTYKLSGTVVMDDGTVLDTMETDIKV
jgi:P pilus assembly chaperone PapD